MSRLGTVLFSAVGLLLTIAGLVEAQPVKALSVQQPRIVLPIGEMVGDGVTLIQGNASELPQVLDRPADDQGATGVAFPAGQISPRAIMLTESTNVDAAGQIIRITFESRVAGQCNVSGHVYIQDNEAGGWWPAGAFTTGNGTEPQNRNVVFRMNGATTSGVNQVGPIHGQAEDWNEFRWMTATNSTSTAVKTPSTFNVVVGTNTLDLEVSTGNHGEGLACDAVAIDFLRGDGIPSGPNRAGGQTCRDVIDWGESHFNLQPATEILAKASTQRVGVLLAGSSLTVRPENWTIRFRGQLHSRYGQCGIAQRTGLGTLNTHGTDIDSAAEEWNRLPAGTDPGFTGDNATGGANYDNAAYGDRGYAWADGQTGSWSATAATGVTSARVVYRTYAAGSTLTIQAGGSTVATVDTTGADNRFAFVEVPIAGGQTLTVSKPASAGAAGLACVIPFNADTGLYFGRLSRNGEMTVGNIAAKDDELRSYIAACGFSLTIYDITNNSPQDSGNTSETRAWLPVQEDAHDALWPSGGFLILYDPYAFELAGFSTSSDVWDEIGGSTRQDWMHQLLALIDTNYFARQPGWMSGYTELGHEWCWPQLFGSGAFVSQSDNGTTRTVSDMHTSFAPSSGGQVVGQAAADIVLRAADAEASVAASIDNLVTAIRDNLDADAITVDTSAASNTAIAEAITVPTLGEIADAVLDEPVGDHTTDGSLSQVLATANSNATATLAATSIASDNIDITNARLTDARAANLDNLDAAVSTLATPADVGTVTLSVDQTAQLLAARDGINKLLTNLRLDAFTPPPRQTWKMRRDGGIVGSRFAIAKQPSERLRVYADVSALLGVADTIEPTSVAFVEQGSASLVIHSDTVEVDGSTLSVEISGGLDGVDTEVEVSVQTTAGKPLAADGPLKIRD